MLPGIFFITTRLVQLFFLIPIIGMLSYFVDGYVHANFLTPSFVLVLFIVVVIAGVWALATLLFYALAKHNGYLISFVDICIWGGLIAGVYELHGIAGQSCGNFDTGSSIYVQLYTFTYEIKKACNMLKACFGLGIMEIFFFFWSALLGLWIHHHHRNDRGYNDRDRKRGSEKHSSRYSNRRRSSRSRSRGPSGANAGYYGGDRDLSVPREPREPRAIRGSSRGPRSAYGGSRRGDAYV